MGRPDGLEALPLAHQGRHERVHGRQLLVGDVAPLPGRGEPLLVGCLGARRVVGALGVGAGAPLVAPRRAHVGPPLGHAAGPQDEVRARAGAVPGPARPALGQGRGAAPAGRADPLAVPVKGASRRGPPRALALGLPDRPVRLDLPGHRGGADPYGLRYAARRAPLPHPGLYDGPLLPGQMPSSLARHGILLPTSASREAPCLSRILREEAPSCRRALGPLARRGRRLRLQDRAQRLCASECN